MPKPIATADVFERGEVGTRGARVEQDGGGVERVQQQAGADGGLSCVTRGQVLRGFSGRVPFDVLTRLPLQNAFRFVEAEYGRGRFADGCAGCDHGAIQCKIIGPVVGARVVETRELAGGGRDRPDVRSLGAIAQSASVAEIVSVRPPAVLLRDDVIDVTSEVGVVFVDQAVFAQMIGPRFDDSA